MSNFRMEQTSMMQDLKANETALTQAIEKLKKLATAGVDVREPLIKARRALDKNKRVQAALS